jgi:hypothetical protein
MIQFQISKQYWRNPELCQEIIPGQSLAESMSSEEGMVGIYHKQQPGFVARRFLIDREFVQEIKELGGVIVCDNNKVELKDSMYRWHTVWLTLLEPHVQFYNEASAATYKLKYL